MTTLSAIDVQEGAGDRPRVVVIGAGVAGLATAALLGAAGYRVCVVEKNSEVGGRAGSLEVADFPGFRWDTGPSWYLMPDAFEHFYQLLGTSTEKELDLVELNPAYRVFSEDTGSLDVPRGPEEAAALFESLEPGAGQALREYLASARDAYGIAVERFLYTTFTAVSPLVHKDVRARAGRLAKLLTQPLAGFVNHRFRDPRLRQILSYPAVFLSSRPEKTPALYHLMSHTDLEQGVFYPRGGFNAVVESLYRLAQENGAEFILGAEATAIVSAANSAGPAFRRGKKHAARGVRVRLSDGSVQDIPADIVVSGADLHHTETQLLPESQRSYPESYFSTRDPGIGTVLVMCGVKGKLPELLHHNLLFSKDWTPDFAAVFEGPQAQRPLGASQSIYVSMPSASEQNVAPEGYENLFLLIPVPAAEGIGHGDAYRPEAAGAVEAIADAALTQLQHWAGIEDLRERIVVRRTLGPADFAERYHAWRGGAIGPAHTLRQSAFFRGRNSSAKVADLYYAGATTVPGVGVPMCLISAENVLKRLWEDSSPGPIDPKEFQRRVMFEGNQG